MTVSTTAISATFSGDGATTVFPFAFPIQDPTQLEVAVGGTTQTTGFTVSGTLPGTGAVTFAVAPAAGTNNVSLTRVVPLTQNLNLTTQTGFYPDAIMNALDKLTMIAQQLAASANSLLLPLTSGQPTDFPPVPAGQALLRIDNSTVGAGVLLWALPHGSSAWEPVVGVAA